MGTKAVNPIAVFICAALISSLAHAQTPEPDNRSLADRLRQQQSELDQRKRRQETLESEKKRLEDDRRGLKKQLIDTGYAVQNSEERLTGLENKLATLAVQQKRIRQKLAIENESIFKLLAAAQRMGRNPPPVIVTRRSDALSMVRSGMQLRYLFPKFQGEIAELQKELSALLTIVNDTKVAKAETEDEVRRLRTEEKRLAELIELRRTSLIANNKNLLKVRDAVVRTEQTIVSLNEHIARNDKAVAENTKLGDYNSGINKLANAEPSRPAPTKTPPVRGPEVEIKVPDRRRAENKSKSATAKLRLAPGGAGITANPERLVPAIPFHLARGRLPLPGRGDRVINYDDKTPRGGRSKGIVIKTRHGASITSPCDGWVVYAGAFRSYGQLLIINAGGGYHILLANLSRLDVQLGQFILAAEPVGAMAGFARGNARPADPVLYVEFRKNGKPIDPGPWWIKNSKDGMQS